MFVLTLPGPGDFAPSQDSLGGVESGQNFDPLRYHYDVISGQNGENRSKIDQICKLYNSKSFNSTARK